MTTDTRTAPPDAATASEMAMLSAQGWERRVPQDMPFIGERTCPAAVAYDLMRDIMLDDPARPPPTSPEFRAYLLDLYAECLVAVRGRRTLGAARPVPSKRNGNAGNAQKPGG